MEPAPQPAGEPPVIEFEDAAIGPHPAGGGAVIEDVCWRVARGDWWVVGGLQWTGKSTFLATAGGIQRPMSGAHRLFGRETGGLPEDALLEQRLRVGMVFDQGGRLFGHLNIAENVALPLCYHEDCALEEALERVAGLMELLDLTRLARALPDRISRDWRQRVGLARALALRPEVLLLDNPLAGLPPRERVWWLDLLDRLHAGHEALGQRPLTLVSSTDDFHPWADHGRQFLLIHDRRCRELGGRADLRGCSESIVRELLSMESTAA
jgi:ABC-type transporter Mla maintaining outer membrane lipid asymmetry ATPase subunit MlaF